MYLRPTDDPKILSTAVVTDRFCEFQWWVQDSAIFFFARRYSICKWIRYVSFTFRLWWGVNYSEWHFYPIQFITAIVDWHLIWSQLTKSQSKFSLLVLIRFPRIFDFMEDNPRPLNAPIIFLLFRVVKFEVEKDKVFDTVDILSTNLCDMIRRFYS